MLFPPIFILGNPRSGTTLFRLVLAAHSKLIIPPESEFIVRLYPKFGHVRSFDRGALLDLIGDISGEKSIVNVEEQWQVSLAPYLDEIDDHVGKSYAEICSSLYFFYARAKGLDGKVIWGDKNNAHGNYIDVLTDLYPKAKFIHVVRDGRAVLSSYQKLNIDKKQKYAPVLPKEVAVVAGRWMDMVSRISRHLKRYSSLECYITIRYEDLLDGFESTAEKVCTFLDIDYESSMLQFYQSNIKYNMEPESYSWKENTRKPLDPAKAEAWRVRLSQSDIASFEQMAAKTLKQYGYQLCTNISGTEIPSVFCYKERVKEYLRSARRLLVITRRLLVTL